MKVRTSVLPKRLREPEVQETLLRALSCARERSTQDSSTVLESDQITALAALAEQNLVTPIVSHYLMNSLQKGAVEARKWTRLHEDSAARTETLMSCLDSIAELFASYGIALVALKNAGIARGLYPCRACCPMGDIDLLVEKLRFRVRQPLDCRRSRPRESSGERRGDRVPQAGRRSGSLDRAAVAPDRRQMDSSGSGTRRGGSDSALGTNRRVGSPNAVTSG